MKEWSRIILEWLQIIFCIVGCIFLFVVIANEFSSGEIHNTNTSDYSLALLETFLVGVGILLAVLGIFGYTQIQTMAENKAKKAAENRVDELFIELKLSEKIEKIVKNSIPNADFIKHPEIGQKDLEELEAEPEDK